MNNTRLFLTAFAFLTLASSSAISEETGLRACLDYFSPSAMSARYRVTIDWKTLDKSRYARIDVGALDRSGYIWAQFRDDRFVPGPDSTEDYFVIDTQVSQYPFQLFVLGLTPEAVAASDSDCKEHGLCSLKRSSPGVALISEPVELQEPTAEPNSCKSN